VINELLFSKLITKGLKIDENSSLDQKPWASHCLFAGMFICGG
jgi:hypothetical protein